MNVTISGRDRPAVEVLLHDEPPVSDVISDDFVMLEDGRYTLSLAEAYDAYDVSFTIGVRTLRPEWNENTGLWEITDRLFGGSFDLASVSVFIEWREGDEPQKLYTDYFRVAMTAQTAERAADMLREIEETLPDYYNICFGGQNNRLDKGPGPLRSVWNAIGLIREAVTVYEQSYGYFLNSTKADVEPTEAIVGIRDMRGVGRDSILWLTQNPDILMPAGQSRGINVRGQSVMPARIRTFLPQYTYEIYENRMAAGFLVTLIHYTEEQTVRAEHEMEQFRSVPTQILGQIPDTHQLSGQYLRIYYSGIMDELAELKNRLLDLQYRYERIFGFESEAVFEIPKLTNTFKQIPAYRMLFEMMVRWFEASDYEAEHHMNYLFRLQTLNKIFEYYCLVKIQAAISFCGFSLISSDRVEYSPGNENDVINNRYVFRGEKGVLTLFYEPYIWVERTNSDMELYSTGYNFSKELFNDYWCPDFLLKYETDRGEFYFILDAKYTTFRNVRRYYLPELVLKYGAQIASKDRPYSSVAAICAMYPGENGEMYTFRRDRVGSARKALPAYYAAAVAPGVKGNTKLMGDLKLMLDDADGDTEN